MGAFGKAVNNNQSDQQEDQFSVNVPKTIAEYAPSAMNVNFSYCTGWRTYTAGTSNVPWEVINMNSLYDPESTQVGHQPNGFAKWTDLYNYYKVIGAKVKVRLVTMRATQTNDDIFSHIVAFIRNTAIDGSNAPDSIITTLEHPRGIDCGVMGSRTSYSGAGSHDYTAVAGLDVHKLIEYKYDPDMFPGTPGIPSHQQFWSPVTANPNILHQFMFGGQRASNVILSQGFRYCVNVEYIAQFRDLRQDTGIMGGGN